VMDIIIFKGIVQKLVLFSVLNIHLNIFLVILKAIRGTINNPCQPLFWK
jgi:hypothetical protein